MNLRTTHQPPQPPDMLPNGLPQITQLRTGRARHVDFNPAYDDRTTERVMHRTPKRLGRPLFFMAVGVVVILGVFVFWQQVVAPWWTGLQDQWNYGSAHITQLDANVGHNGLSHFIAEYHNNEIVVIELSYTNPANSHIYTLNGMVSSAAKPVVILSTTKDVHTGLIDLVIDVEGSGFQTVLYNTGTAFSETQP